jgi:2-dehydro-3-deoxyphosphooctonate aldolase (KDO 8-P synthase)
LTTNIEIGRLKLGGDSPLLIIAGPCVIENEDIVFHTAERLKEICSNLGLQFIFKSSYDKANRTSISSFRGPGIEKGLRILSDVKDRVGVPVISDVHSVEEIRIASEVLDVLQIPAFLCRQTDLIIEASKTGKPVNVKKGQFLAPWDVRNIIDKFIATGNNKIFITERGASFGYNNLVVDFRAFPIMRSYGYPVIFDVTHSVQLPGGKGTSSSGQREFAAPLARAAVAAGIDGIFMEVHPEPEKALCDGPNMIKLSDMHEMLKSLKAIDELVKHL